MPIVGLIFRVTVKRAPVLPFWGREVLADMIETPKQFCDQIQRAIKVGMLSGVDIDVKHVLFRSEEIHDRSNPSSSSQKR